MGTTKKSDFELALEDWTAAARKAQASRELYRCTWARAYVTSTEKTDTSRKAGADVCTTEQRAQRDVDQIAVDSAYHWMIHLRGPEVVYGSKTEA